ncbi:MAG: hypothetical protein ACOYXY_21940 [Thermodesulfobacteriota bacterium]
MGVLEQAMQRFESPGPVPAFVPTQGQPEDSIPEAVVTVTTPWSEAPLIEMLPVSRRAEAQEIIDSDPAMIDVLRECKWGLHDCWTCLERLGLNPWAE